MRLAALRNASAGPATSRSTTPGSSTNTTSVARLWTSDTGPPGARRRFRSGQGSRSRDHLREAPIEHELGALADLRGRHLAPSASAHREGERRVGYVAQAEAEVRSMPRSGLTALFG